MSRTVLIFGREPAVILGVIAATIQLLSSTALHLTVDQQAALNAVAVGVLGVTVAFMVHDGVVAAFTPAFHALIACALGFGVHMAPDVQSAIMLVVTAVGSAFVRHSVTSKVSKEQLRSGLRLAA